jgi:hypothetical protein
MVASLCFARSLLDQIRHSARISVLVCFSEKKKDVKSHAMGRNLTKKFAMRTEQCLGQTFFVGNET